MRVVLEDSNPDYLALRAVEELRNARESLDLGMEARAHFKKAHQLITAALLQIDEQQETR